jgi:transcription elongation factor GreA
MDKEPITLNGLNKLKKELVYLKEKKRPEIVAAIAEARSHGDLKENAEYHAAKEEQSHNEGRIRKGPAPWNMEVPKYEFVNANTIKIG